MRPRPAPAAARVSVIVPCHNHGHLVGEALDSIAAQGVADLEIVVVDDRSTDDTAAVATARGIRVVTSATPGAAAARNAGLAATTGELVAFLDADDVWMPGSLRSRLGALGDADAVFGAVDEFVEPGFEGSVPRTMGPTRMAGALLTTRRAWELVGTLDESLRVGEFIDWVARFDAAGLSAVSIGDVVLLRRIHAANTSRAHDAASYLRVARLHRSRRAQ